MTCLVEELRRSPQDVKRLSFERCILDYLDFWNWKNRLYWSV